MENNKFFGIASLRRGAAQLFRAIVLVAVAVIVSGCSKQPDYRPDGDGVAWIFGPREIVLNLKASESLNLFEGKAHTLAMCVYQLSSDKSFNTLGKTPEGVSQLMACQRFDDTVISFEQIFVAPREARSVVLDRQEGTRILGLAAGYYASTNSSARSVPIPVENSGVLSFLGAGRKVAAKLVLDVRLERTDMQFAKAARGKK